jgi:hypothetical protein
LYNNQNISLEGIGEFSFEKELSGIRFNQDKRAITSPSFINYVAEKEAKNKLLVSSDIESFLSQTRQFINIGRPFVIDGVGTVQLNKHSQYEFLPGMVTRPVGKESESSKKQKVIQPAKLKEEKPARKRSINLNIIALIIAIIIIVGIAGSIYYYSSDGSSFINDNEVEANNSDIKQDSSPIIKTQSAVSILQEDSINYHFVFEVTTDSQRAYKRYNQLARLSEGINIDSVASDTSTFYKLYVLKKSLAADTTFIKDSLSLYLGRQVSIEQNTR